MVEYGLIQFKGVVEMGVIKNAIYKVDNGIDYDSIYFKTSSAQVVDASTGTTVKADLDSIKEGIASGELKGDTWKPTVTVSGDLSWTIDDSLTPPTPVNIKGVKGDTGATGANGTNGFTWRPSVDSAGNLTWSQNSSTTTPTPANIKGAKGDTGAPGANGADGTQITVSNTQPPTHIVGQMWIQTV